MSTFETIYVIGHTIGSFLLLMVQFFVVKNYVVPFAKKVYHFVMWRQHSWLIHRKPRSNRIVETTRPRVLYYGFAMSLELSERFADEVLDSIMF